jgi:hypothetical protein
VRVYLIRVANGRGIIEVSPFRGELLYGLSYTSQQKRSSIPEWPTSQIFIPLECIIFILSYSHVGHW